jgi:Coenzyme PQQ synthesis protein D (PqqD)
MADLLGFRRLKRRFSRPQPIPTCYRCNTVPPLFHYRKNMLTLNSIIQRSPEVIAAEADQDLVMVSIATGYYYGVSDVAREIWDAIGSPKRISDLVDDLTANYEIDSSSCEEQTLSFLNALLDEGLLQVEDAPAS